MVVWWYGSRVKGTRHLTSITDAQQMGTSDDVGSLNHPLQSFPVSDFPRQDAFYCSSVKVLLVFFFYLCGECVKTMIFSLWRSFLQYTCSSVTSDRVRQQ